MVDAEKIKEEFKKITTMLILRFPFLGLTLRKLRVVINNKYPTAGVNRNNIIVINPEFFMSLNEDARRDVLVHEALHIIFKCFPRFDKIKAKYLNQGYIEAELMKIWNIAHDCKINQFLLEFYDSSWIREHGITPLKLRYDFDIEDPENKTAEEIFEELIEKAEKIESPFPDMINEGKGGNSEGEKEGKSEEKIKEGEGQEKEEEVINEGDEDFYKGKKTIEELVRETYVISKSIGNMPLGAERMIKELLKPKIDWRQLLKAYVESYIRKKASITWLRPNRRTPSLPSYKYYSLSKIITLIDSSGSIGENELSQFLGELFGIAREKAEITVIFWDAEAYEPQKVKRPRDVLRIMPKGGGGTVISSGLKKALEIMKRNEIIVILTDGEIADDNWETKDLLRKVMSKALDVIFVTTNSIPEVIKNLGIKTVKLEMD